MFYEFANVLRASASNFLNILVPKKTTCRFKSTSGFQKPLQLSPA